MNNLRPWAFQVDAGFWAIVLEADARTQLNRLGSGRVTVIVIDLDGHTHQPFANDRHAVVIVAVFTMVNGRVLGNRHRTCGRIDADAEHHQPTVGDPQDIPGIRPVAAHK